MRFLASISLKLLVQEVTSRWTLPNWVHIQYDPPTENMPPNKREHHMQMQMRSSCSLWPEAIAGKSLIARLLSILLSCG